MEATQREQALQAGRATYEQGRIGLHRQILDAAIEGMPYERIAELTGIGVDEVFLIASAAHTHAPRVGADAVFDDARMPLRVALVGAHHRAVDDTDVSVLAVGVLDPVSGVVSMIWRGQEPTYLTRARPTTEHVPARRWLDDIRSGQHGLSLIVLDPPMSEPQQRAMDWHGAIHDIHLAAAATRTRPDAATAAGADSDPLG